MRGPEKGRIHLQFKNITLSLCRQWISLPYPIKKIVADSKVRDDVAQREGRCRFALLASSVLAA